MTLAVRQCCRQRTQWRTRQPRWTNECGELPCAGGRRRHRRTARRIDLRGTTAAQNAHIGMSANHHHRAHARTSGSTLCSFFSSTMLFSAIFCATHSTRLHIRDLLPHRMVEEAIAKKVRRMRWTWSFSSSCETSPLSTAFFSASPKKFLSRLLHVKSSVRSLGGRVRAAPIGDNKTLEVKSFLSTSVSR